MPRKKKEPEIVVEEEIIEGEPEDIINDDGLDDGIELPPQAEEKLQELIDLGKKKTQRSGGFSDRGQSG